MGRTKLMYKGECVIEWGDIISLNDDFMYSYINPLENDFRTYLWDIWWPEFSADRMKEIDSMDISDEEKQQLKVLYEDEWTDKFFNGGMYNDILWEEDENGNKTFI